MEKRCITALVLAFKKLGVGFFAGLDVSRKFSSCWVIFKLSPIKSARYTRSGAPRIFPRHRVAIGAGVLEVSNYAIIQNVAFTYEMRSSIWYSRWEKDA